MTPAPVAGARAEAPTAYASSVSEVPAVGLVDIAPVKSEAEMKWNKVRFADRGQTLGSAIDDCEILISTALTLFDANDYERAREKYQATIAACDRVLAQDAARERALGKRRDAEAAKREAEAEVAAQNATEIWNSATALMISAEETFERTEFAEAGRNWVAAASEFSKAANYARFRKESALRAQAEAKRQQRAAAEKKAQDAQRKQAIMKSIFNSIPRHP